MTEKDYIGYEDFYNRAINETTKGGMKSIKSKEDIMKDVNNIIAATIRTGQEVI